MSKLSRVLAELAERQPHLIEPSLEGITYFADALGQPQQAYPSIHITGTNGKTSTARMIDALLRAAGLRTGRYTSPHLERVNERISLDGAPLTDEQLVIAYDDVAMIAGLVDERLGRRLTYFEFMTGMAFAAFADAPVDAAVVEVGLGGTWDATNVVDAAVSVVTPIGLDHMEFLGGSLESIATEKAGIMREGAIAILSRQELAAAQTLLAKAVETGTTVAREGLEFAVLQRHLAVGGQMLTLKGIHAEYDEVFLPLHGAHQAGNAVTALAAVEAFLDAGELDVELVREGFAMVDSPGRLEVIRHAPNVLLDGAHNPSAARALAEALDESFAFERLIGVVAILGDKDAEGVLEALEPVVTHLIVTQNSSPRCMPLADLADLAEDIFGAARVSTAARLDDAIEQAVALAEAGGSWEGGGVLVTGSLFTVGEARALLAPDLDFLA